MSGQCSCNPKYRGKRNILSKPFDLGRTIGEKSPRSMKELKECLGQLERSAQLAVDVSTNRLLLTVVWQRPCCHCSKKTGCAATRSAPERAVGDITASRTKASWKNQARIGKRRVKSAQRRGKATPRSLHSSAFVMRSMPRVVERLKRGGESVAGPHASHELVGSEDDRAKLDPTSVLATRRRAPRRDSHPQEGIELWWMPSSVIFQTC